MILVEWDNTRSQTANGSYPCYQTDQHSKMPTVHLAFKRARSPLSPTVSPSTFSSRPASINAWPTSGSSHIEYPSQGRLSNIAAGMASEGSSRRSITALVMKDALAVGEVSTSLPCLFTT